MNNLYKHISEIDNIIGDEELEGNCFYEHKQKGVVRNAQSVRAMRNNLKTLGSKAKNILEIGFNAGHSAVLFLHDNPNAKYVGVDIGRHEYTVPCFLYLKKHFNMELEIGNSREVLKNYKTSIPFDLIHIDGGHGKDAALADLLLCKKYSNENTLIILDDTSTIPHVKKLAELLIDSKYIKEIKMNDIKCLDTVHHKVYKYNFETPGPR
tara:strand:+ start:1365 stop:1991 length:627 start_codon:yes stop_codon:yes gene_type:complete